MMLKARIDNTIVIGLSERNLELLKQDKPIAFDGAEIGLDGWRVLIFYGRTEQQMEQDLINAGFRIPQ